MFTFICPILAKLPEPIPTATYWILGAIAVTMALRIGPVNKVKAPTIV